jgi:hypothetical protein
MCVECQPWAGDPSFLCLSLLYCTKKELNRCYWKDGSFQILHSQILINK